MKSPDKPTHDKSRPGSIGLVLLLGLLTAIGPLSIDMYLPGLPELARALHSSQGNATLTVAIFFLGMAAGQLIYGPVSDRTGRRGPLLVGLSLYLVGSVGCALAPSLAVLTGMRLLQAIGACSGTVIARAIVRDHFEPQDSARIYSRLILVMGVSPIFAPLLGGFVLLVGDWRSIFWVLTGLGLTLLIAVAFLLGESRTREMAAHAARENILASFGAVLRAREVVGFILTGTFNNGALITYVASSPAILIGVYHIPVQAFGWVFGINGFGFILASQINARLVRRHRPLAILQWACRGTVAIAAILFANALTGFGGLWGILAPLFALLSCLGFTMPNAMASALARDPTRAGATSALFGTAQYGIGALGATIASVTFDHSARPMAATMIAFALIAFAMLHWVVPARRS